MYLSLMVSPVVRLFCERVVERYILPSGVVTVSSRALQVCNCGAQMEWVPCHVDARVQYTCTLDES